MYLVAGDRLRLRAASPVYARQVGRIEFGVDEGLAGWAVGHREAAFIRERAMDDPRTNYIPELEEDRFQSMAAVPVPSRSGDVLGVIVLHTAAPHEFDEGILNVLSQTASVIAGAIENAKLYEESQQRVADLTRLSSLSQRIAAVTQRADLYRVATTGVRELLPCDHCRLLELDPSGTARRRRRRSAGRRRSGAAARRPRCCWRCCRARRRRRCACAASRAVRSRSRSRPGSELLGALMVSAAQPWHDHGDELLRAIAHQIAVALEKTELIESLSEEGIARELFAALQEDRIDVAHARARKLGADLERPHVVLEARPLSLPAFADGADARLERSLRQAVPGTICDADGRRVRALVPGGDPGALVGLLGPVAREYGVAIGASTVRRGAADTRAALAEAADAAFVGVRLLEDGGVLPYADMGAYRYLVGPLRDGGPQDPLREAVDRLAAYDRERGAQLLLTLERYLENGRSLTTSARELTVHVNTLRQRLDRIESLTGLDLAAEDLLALQLAIKLALLRRHPAPPR